MEHLRACWASARRALFCCWPRREAKEPAVVAFSNPFYSERDDVIPDAARVRHGDVTFDNPAFGLDYEAPLPQDAECLYESDFELIPTP